MKTTTKLDHVAVAVERWADAWPWYAAELGGRWVFGNFTVGFAAHTLRYANGTKLELLRPNAVERDDFLRRFLDRHGVGPHHLTFKVDDLLATLAHAESMGYRPVNVRVDNPLWKEAFLHPSDAPGIVVQIAEEFLEASTQPPPGFPVPAHGEPARFDLVTHGVRDLDGALHLFAGLLGGEETGRGDSEDGQWVELGWNGVERLRLLRVRQGTVADEWVGARPGRLLHLTFSCPWLASSTTVDAEVAFGVPLVLQPASSHGR